MGDQRNGEHDRHDQQESQDTNGEFHTCH